MNRHKEIKASYQSLGKGFANMYDGIIETYRVLRKGGIFCGCFYIRDEFKRTDWFVRHMYVPKGFFTPPFETQESLRDRLKGLYSQADVHAVNAEGIFCCVK